MFINTKVAHKVYGTGVITDLEINSKSHIDSRLVVKFNKTGEIKKFPMKVFKDESIFTTEDPEIITYVLEHGAEPTKPVKLIRYSDDEEECE